MRDGQPPTVKKVAYYRFNEIDKAQLAERFYGSGGSADSALRYLFEKAEIEI
jgi:hypothetical protein